MSLLNNCNQFHKGDRRQRRVRAELFAGNQYGGGVQASQVVRRLDGHLRQGLRLHHISGTGKKIQFNCLAETRNGIKL